VAGVAKRKTKKTASGEQWYAIVSLGGNHKKWVQLPTATDEASARRLAKREQKRFDNMKDDAQARAAASNKRFRDAWTEFRASHVSKLRENTRQDYDYTYKNHLDGAAFASKPLPRITVRDLEAYIKLKQQTLSEHTINNHLGMLRKLFRWSMDRDYCATNPAKATGLRFPVHDSRVFFTPEQSQLFLACMATQGLKAEAIAAVGLWCGLRWSEIRGLSWDVVDISDPKHANLLVRRQVVFVPKPANAPAGTKGGYHVIKVPKTEAGFRQVGIPESVALILRRWEQDPANYTTSTVMKTEKVPAGLVFPSSAGGVMSDSNFGRREFRVAKQMAKRLDPSFPDEATIHSMRHSFATSMLLEGMSLYDLRGQMGHSSVQTSARYGHYVPEKRTSKTASALEKSIRRATKANSAALQKLQQQTAAKPTKKKRTRKATAPASAPAVAPTTQP